MTTPNVLEGAIVGESTDTALAVLEAERMPDTVRTRRAPQVVLAEAHTAAAALLDVMKSKKKQVVFNGETYLEFEDWQTIAHFYGLTAKIESDAFVEFGAVRGFEATAIALDRAGREVSRAVAMCLNDEDNWSTRPKHEWHYVLKSDPTKTQLADPGRDEIIWVDGKPKKLKVFIANEPVPLFQLRSMAQTRACARVLRQVLGFVPVLAGYRPTPSEEMTGAERVDAEFVSDGAGLRPATADDKTPARRSAPAEASFDDTPKPAAPKPVAKSAPPATDTPKPTAAPKPAAAAIPVFTVEKVLELKKGTNSKGDWVKYGIVTAELGESKKLVTFDRERAKLAFAAKRDGLKVRVRYTEKVSNGYTDLEVDDIAIVPPAEENVADAVESTREPGMEG